MLSDSGKVATKDGTEAAARYVDKSTWTMLERIEKFTGKNMSEELQAKGDELAKAFEKKFNLKPGMAKELATRLPGETWPSRFARAVNQTTTRQALMKVGAALGVAGQQGFQSQAEKVSAEQGTRDAYEGTKTEIQTDIQNMDAQMLKESGKVAGAASAAGQAEREQTLRMLERLAQGGYSRQLDAPRMIPDQQRCTHNSLPVECVRRGKQ